MSALQQSGSFLFSFKGVPHKIGLRHREDRRSGLTGQLSSLKLLSNTTEDMKPSSDQHIEIDRLWRREVEDNDTLENHPQTSEQFHRPLVELCRVRPIARHLRQALCQHTQRNNLRSIALSLTSLRTARDMDSSPNCADRSNGRNSADDIASFEAERLSPKPCNAPDQSDDISDDKGDLVKRSHSGNAAISAGVTP